MLAAALGDGRLTQDEHSERMAAALSARTLGELAGLTSDLAPPAQQPVRLDDGKVVAAVFGTEERHGRWVVPPVVTCSAVCGEAVLDLREAMLQDRHVVLNVYAFFGRVRLIVPAGVEVAMNGTEVIGRQRGATVKWVPSSADVPVVEVRGLVVMSEVLVRTPPRPRRWLLRRRRASLP